MKNGFQAGARASLGKNQPRQSGTIQPAIRGQNLPAEPPDDFLQRRLARLGQLARYRVGIRHCNAALRQQLAGG